MCVPHFMNMMEICPPGPAHPRLPAPSACGHPSASDCSDGSAPCHHGVAVPVSLSSVTPGSLVLLQMTGRTCVRTMLPACAHSPPADIGAVLYPGCLHSCSAEPGITDTSRKCWLSFPLRVRGSKIAGTRGRYIFNLLRSPRMFSMKTVPIPIATEPVPVPFSHLLVNTDRF